MKQIVVVAALLLVSTPLTAQLKTRVNEEPVFFKYTNHEVNAKALADSSLYKRSSNWQRIVDQFWGPGWYEVNFHASGLASGVYLYRLAAGTFVQTRKMLLIQ